MATYVWDHEGCLCDYTDGIMIADAESVSEARELIKEQCDYIGKDLSVEPRLLKPKEAIVLWGGS